MIYRNHPAARPKGLGPDDLAQVILDSIDDDEPPTALYTLNIHEARMLANAVLNVVQAATRVGRVSDEAEIAASEAYAQGAGERPFSQRMRAALTAALPRLESASEENITRLRDTPAGRALMAEALEEEAYVMDVVISNGDAAEVAAHAPGESGRGSAVGARDALYENPAQYLRNRARTYRTETPNDRA